VIALAGDVDGEGRVLESIMGGVSDDRITDDFAPVVQRQLGREQRGFVDRAFLERLTQILGFGG
jgi:hypothetical protein